MLQVSIIMLFFYYCKGNFNLIKVLLYLSSWASWAPCLYAWSPSIPGSSIFQIIHGKIMRNG